jgi:hypothetical protein
MKIIGTAFVCVLLCWNKPATAKAEHSEAWIRTGQRACKEQPSSWAKIRENANVRCSDFSLYIALLALHKDVEAEKLVMSDEQMKPELEKQKGPTFGREFTNQCYKKYLAGILEKDDDRCWDAINDVGLIDEDEYKRRE